MFVSMMEASRRALSPMTRQCMRQFLRWPRSAGKSAFVYSKPYFAIIASYRLLIRWFLGIKSDNQNSILVSSSLVVECCFQRESVRGPEDAWSCVETYHFMQPYNIMKGCENLAASTRKSCESGMSGIECGIERYNVCELETRMNYYMDGHLTVSLLMA